MVSPSIEAKLHSKTIPVALLSFWIVLKTSSERPVAIFRTPRRGMNGFVLVVVGVETGSDNDIDGGKSVDRGFREDDEDGVIAGD